MKKIWIIVPRDENNYNLGPCYQAYTNKAEAEAEAEALRAIYAEHGHSDWTLTVEWLILNED